jgi:uncharacterized protein (DUF1778 family)
MRSVVLIRLSDQERGQIASAATRLQLTLSGFIRQAALQASAVVERKASVKAKTPAEPERRELVIADLEPSIHHDVDGICMRSWRDVDERDLHCSKQRELMP